MLGDFLTMYKHFFKRVFDIILALIGIIITFIPIKDSRYTYFHNYSTILTNLLGTTITFFKGLFPTYSLTLVLSKAIFFISS